MAEELPATYIGEVYYSQTDVAPAWASVSQQWYANTTILMPPGLEYCNGQCEGNIRATGVITNCSSITTSVDLSNSINGTTVFAITSTQGEDYAHIPTLTFTATYSTAVDNSTCVATIVNDTCDVKVASVQYPIVIENQAITFNSDKYLNIGELESYAGDSPNASQGDLAGPLGGLSWTLYDYWGAYGEVITVLDPETNSTTYSFISTSIVVGQYFNYRKEDINENDACVITFNQPTDDIVESLRQMMFRAGLYLAAANDTHDIPMVQTTSTLVYQSEYSWFGVAIAVLAIATFSCIIPLWGWWDLGRKVTLNPIETAKAFNV